MRCVGGLEIDKIPKEFSNSIPWSVWILRGSRSTYRFVRDTKTDSLPLDYCGVVSFCGPVRNITNIDARSSSNRRVCSIDGSRFEITSRIMSCVWSTWCESIGTMTNVIVWRSECSCCLRILSFQARKRRPVP